MNKSAIKILKAFITLLPLAVAANAQAHIVLENKKAEAGNYYKATLQVGHGCSGSPIREIVVEIPAGVKGAKPMPKAGWNIHLEKSTLAQPYMHEGSTVTEGVTQVRWSGGELADSHYDEFVLLAKLPDQAGPLYWKVSQICEKGRVDWAEIPAPGKKPFDYKTPAAVMEVLPAAHGGHKH